MLDLGDMRALDIDVECQTAWAETGLTAGEYAAAAGAHGLVTGFGDTGSVGIGGLTLGGGVGLLVRKAVPSRRASRPARRDGLSRVRRDRSFPATSAH